MPTDIALTGLAMPIGEFPAIAREAEARGYRTAWAIAASTYSGICTIGRSGRGGPMNRRISVAC